MDPDWLNGVIRNFRDSGAVLPAFDRRLDALTGDTDQHESVPDDSSDHEIRAEAASFVLHAIRDSLHDHILSETEADAIEALKYGLGLDEGDLQALQHVRTRDFLSSEIESMLADGAIDDSESLRKSGLQRALGLGYDQFLFLAQDGMRPAVERILEDARHERRHGGGSPSLDRLKRLRTFVRIDFDALEAIWPNAPRG
ncbi:hypothetical protein [Luteimonas sp. 3794]|uniref:hypothetical protein n=1 Tax=Luteimonas sp. 3794 TaxID=2817730 RepID=UPI00286262B9|nr:hypothetical protein [Luteimonas sp. 3794]MDR6992253.1 hypothetical protein [Luteimonas sp. 3794]